MIRRLVVPPFEALDPLPPRGAGSRSGDPGGGARASWRTCSSGATRRCASIPAGSTASTSRPESGSSTRPAGRVRWTGSPPRSAARSAWPWTGCAPITSTSASPASTSTEADGSVVGMKVTPLDRVGLYVPGGKASYPSSVIMNAVPAAGGGGAGDRRGGPARRGVTDAVLAACALSGVTRIFRIGGAQAVAALAYGTATVPRVDKIVGPGNRWVAEAKRQVVGQVGIDMIAGPTEVLILADATRAARRGSRPT